MAGCVGQEGIEAPFRRACCGNDIAAEMFGWNDFVAQAGILELGAMQLLVHQAQSKLLLGLRLVVVILKLPRVFTQFLLGSATLGNVADNADDHALVVKDDLGDCNGGRESMSVLVQCLQFSLGAKGGGWPFRAEILNVLRMRLALRGWHQDGNVLANQFAGGPAEYAFGGLVDRDDIAAFVAGDDGVEDVVRNGLDPAQSVD